LLEYDSLPSNTFDSLGQHWCDCKSAQSINHLIQHNRVVINPNPITGGQFTVTSSLPFESIEVVSIIGKSVCFLDFANRQREAKVTLNNPSAGVYLVKVTYNDHQSEIKKIIIQ
jgi:hypothetical protein